MQYNLGLPASEERLAHQTLTRELWSELYPELCFDCKGFLSFTYENNGFSAPDPEHWEVTRVYCEHCDKEICNEEVL